MKTKTIKNFSRFNTRAGFTLIEVIVGLAILGVLIVGVMATYTMLTRTVKINREKTELTTLADSHLEIVRNLPYSQLGTVSGSPHGALPDFSNPEVAVLESATYNLYYEVTYVDDPADGTALTTDATPNDYKQIKMFVRRVSDGVINTFLTSVSPKGLEGAGTGGSLWVKVFNASGQPVSGANIHIQSTQVGSNIILDRQSAADGNWVEVGLPASVNGYHVVVSKAGYSSDQTYPITAQNPNPIKPDATILAGQVTQVSFSIDLLSNLTINTYSQTCQPLSNIGVNVRGDKKIGTNPDVYKFNQSFASVLGQIILNSLEWDTYTPALLSGQPYMVYGTSPIQNINVLPGTSQVFTMILGPITTNSLLVIVKDASTGSPLEGAVVHLRKGGSVPQDYYGTTGGSIWLQKDWTGGDGQADFVDQSRYFSDNNNIDINSMPTGIRLKKISGDYQSPGILESSTFDTGTSASNFTTITWEPTSQNPSTELKFQVATNNDNATWNYKGPDGTAATYYTVSGNSISSVHDNNRYIRYRVYEATTNDHRTPILTSVGINYVAGCFTPGQAIFTGLTAGNNYDLDINLAGYQTAVANNLDIFGNQILEITLSP